MDNNAYLLVCRATNEALLIDAANEPERLADLVGAGDGRPELRHVVTTHRHHDHWQALGAVAGMFETRQIAHPLDAPELPIPTDELVRARRHGPVRRDRARGGAPARAHPGLDRAGLPGRRAARTSSPATRCSRAALARRRSPADFSSLMDDLEERVFGELPDETWVYPGHGDDTTLGKERPHRCRSGAPAAGDLTRGVVAGSAMRCAAGSPSWPARPGAPAAASPRRWARPARRSSAPDAAARRAAAGRTTTGPRRSRRRPSSSPQLGGIGIAVAGRPSRLRRRCDGWPSAIRDEHGRIDVLVNDIWGAEVLKGGPAEWNTPIWEHDLDDGSAHPPPRHRHPPRSRRTTCCRCSIDRAGRPARRGDRRHHRLQRVATTGSRCSTTWPRSP